MGSGGSALNTAGNAENAKLILSETLQRHNLESAIVSVLQRLNAIEARLEDNGNWLVGEPGNRPWNEPVGAQDTAELRSQLDAEVKARTKMELLIPLVTQNHCYEKMERMSQQLNECQSRMEEMQQEIKELKASAPLRSDDASGSEEAAAAAAGQQERGSPRTNTTSLQLQEDSDSESGSSIHSDD